MTTVLALVAALLAQDKYKIEGTVQDAVREDKRPVFRCEGTSTLPEGSRLDLRLYYGRVRIGRHLHFRALELKEGRFAIDFAVFAGKNPAGTYSVQVEFNPYQQQREVTEKLGKDLRHYAAVLPLTIGSDADAVEARRQTHLRLAGAVEKLRSILEAADRKCAEKPATDEWRRLVRAWAEEAHEVETSLHGVPEFKAFDVDDISEIAIEDLVRTLHCILDGLGACLADPANADAAAALVRYRKSFENQRRQTLLRLGLEKSSDKELREALKMLRPLLVELLPIYRAARKAQNFDRTEYYRAKVSAARKNLRERVLPVCETAPEKHRDALRTLLEKAVEFLRVAIDAGGAIQEDREKVLQAALDEFERHLKTLQDALQE